MDLENEIINNDAELETTKTTKLNPYVQYFFGRDFLQFIFAALLSTIVVSFCAYKLSQMTASDPQLSIYLTPMISLVTLWVPVKMLKTPTIPQAIKSSNVAHGKIKKNCIIL